MIRHIRLRHVDSTVAHDDTVSEATMRSNCPMFFANGSRGSRETITVYRGGIIVRETVRFSHGSERRTVVYLYFPSLRGDGRGCDGRPGTYHLSSDCASIYQAQRLIDRVLATYRADPDEAPVRSKNG